ncbi:MAG: carbohydrate binding domain-containing protein [Lachnospiraceae bacterium]|nr:carbohydrate binding domain-containing protein [Lachnospiraceae bacterium]
MKKKIVCMLLAVTMSVGMLAGCSNKEVSDEAVNMTETMEEAKTKEAVVVQEEIDVAYNLVWEDNFDGDTLNLADWNYEYHEPGWVNNELQEYVDSSENIYVKDGKLVIQALKALDEEGNVYYTSGRVNTQNKHDYKYGRFEAKAKVPSGKGFLPAFWMMPTDENLYGQWPKCGEIDIMEVLGDNTDETHGTLHFGEPHTQSQGSYVLEDGDFASEYHVFACEWEPGEIRFYVDGILYHTENDWFTKKTGYGEVTYPAPYDQPFYMILNLAVGGNWPGNPDESTEFGENATLCVDYVKVYQKDNYDENVTKPVKEVVFSEADESGNYIVNGDFAVAEDLTEADNWQFLLAGTGSGSAEISDHAIHISPRSIGDLDYSVQLVQPNLPMICGHQYKVSFDAYAEEARSVIVDISAPDNGWIRYLPDTRVMLTTEKQTYEFPFDMTGNSDPNGRLEFNFGNQMSIAGVHISNVRVEKIGEFEVETNEKNVLPNGNYVYNGEFQEGNNRLDYWMFESKMEGAEAAVTNVNNVRELKVTVPDTVAALEEVCVKQEAVAIKGGKTYILSFDAYADGDKTIQTQIAEQAWDVALTAKKATYKYAFTPAADLNGSELAFLLGVSGEIYLDNVCVQEDALLINGDFSNGMTGYEVYAYNTSDVSYVIDSLNEDNAFSMDIMKTGSLDWYIQLKQNGIKLEKGKTYTLTMDAKATIDRKIMYALQRDGSADDDWTAYSGSTLIDITQDYQTFSTTFTMEHDTDTATILSISMGAVDGAAISDKHSVIIDNITLTEVQ